jgi:N-acetylneuraminic acid mutarotase
MPRILRHTLAAGLVLAALAVPWASADSAGSFTPTGSLSGLGRGQHAGVRLLDGRVLVVGGYGTSDGSALATAETFDPATGTWSAAGTMATPRVLAGASLLPDGRVLVTGGSNEAAAHASAEIWDPVSASFSAAASMSVARFAHTSTTLLDGRVLVTGGNASTDSPLPTTSAALYDPATNTWSATGSLLQRRQTHTAVLLGDGRVLVVGGDEGIGNTFVGTTLCQAYDPVTGAFSAVASTSVPRAQHASARLLDGRVLVVGGNSNATGSQIHAAEVYSPSTDTWSSASSTGSGGMFPTLTVLADGRVLATGGQSPSASPTDLADVFDPTSGTWTAVGSMNQPRLGHTAALLGDGSVLLAGGYQSFTTAPYWNTACERFLPGTPNAAPTADAGPDQAIHAGDVVTLSGTGSHDDDTATSSLLYAWTLTQLPAGSTAALDDAASATPAFTADVTGTYVVTLVVTDEEGLPSVADEVSISSTNVPPTAQAGPDLATEVDVAVTLAGSASDPEDDALTYAWTIISAPAGSTATLDDATTATPSLTPDEVGTYVLALVASDPYDDSAADTVTVTAISGTVDVEALLRDALQALASLPKSAFSSPGQRLVLSLMVSAALADVRHGHDDVFSRWGLARVLERMDGCALRGAVDSHGQGKDWIVTQAGQAAVYPLLREALDALEA